MTTAARKRSVMGLADRVSAVSASSTLPDPPDAILTLQQHPKQVR
jgi:hypothetical protein